MPFIDVKTDFAFKKVFGSAGSKDILLSFLNAVLDLGTNPIVDLTIINPYQIPLVEGLKETYVDVHAKLDNGTTVIIEMQAYNQTGFGKRIQSNLAKAYSTQLRPRDKYTEHSPVIALTVTDFVMFTDDKLKSTVITYFKFLETSKFILFPDNQMEMVFVELPKFDKKEDKLTSTADKWIYFIKQAGQLTSIPKALADDETINHALEVANAASLTPEELEIQQKKARWLADHKEAEQVMTEKQMAIAEKQAALAKLAQSETKLAQSETKLAQSETKLAQSDAEKEAAIAEKEAALEKAEKAEKVAEKTTTLRLAKQMLQANADIAFIMQVTGLEEALIKKLSE